MSTVIDVLSLCMRRHPDILRAQGPHVGKVLNTVLLCRSGQLGASLKRCAGCGHEEIIAHSCRNRHCPRCQGAAAYQWLASQEQKLLPVPYFHLVFTLPHRFNELFAQNQKACYNLLFNSASETLLEFGRNEWGAKLGITSVLHTWGQSMVEHYHLHCIVTGGGISNVGDVPSWKSSPAHWLFPVKALSAVFRGKFLAKLKVAVKAKQLQLGNQPFHSDSEPMRSLIEGAYRQPWNVHAKRPFKGPGQVLRYLSLYTHRIAISDKRIEQLDAEGDRVEINYKDYRNSGKRKRMWLTLRCFLARYCAHILPRCFVKIRHYGLLANRGVTERISKLREQITASQQAELCDLIATIFSPKNNDARQGRTTAEVCPRCGHAEYVIVPVATKAISRCLARKLTKDHTLMAGASP